ncbi:hypothetical protein BD626DRAFT_629237 [Schizophyllum amplum]|uniref:Uncharacterized protein n=1 Tax=Schizophyllum amplum TaxID=97359 RepID=A0A550CHL6_9AGAR|nr:hypothetical protein BD626DRAFT_629237 [Auriculariopsis ampla]
MPPKPRPLPSKKLDGERKPSTADMPPPPQPTAILVPEAAAMAGCLKTSAVKAAQIYKFFADARRLGVDKHAPNPPRSLTAALGTQVAKYDQLCDHIESRLLRAIAVLQQELTEEERRIAKAQATAPSSPMSIDPQLPPVANTTTPATSPVVPTNSSARRGSTISLSSLNRAPFPHKLDLSSVRGPADDILGLASGLSSPVTLAPKSARPMSTAEYANDIMAALTSSSSDPSQAPLSAAMGGPPSAQMGAPPSQMGPPPPPSMGAIDLTGDDLNVPGPGDVGGSAEKPIELDLESMEGMQLDMPMDMDMGMNIFHGAEGAGAKADGGQMQQQSQQDTAMFDFSALEGTQKDDNEPSPASLLAQFQSGEGTGTEGTADDLFGDSGTMGNLGEFLGNVGGTDASGGGGGDGTQQVGDAQPSTGP